ncbi:acyltransferase [Microbacterium sp. AZCO]|uniref:acyltransferase n=1 Tax=Microbacterium sp. AZCO TaxID=3142976 RepID=UPI0031F3B10C
MTDTVQRNWSLIDRNTRPKAWVDVAKGVAMFMVVIFHTSLYFGHADITGYPGRLKLFLEAFPMPAFFVISGLFALRVSTWTLPQLWKRRLLPLLWLYVVWSLVRFVFYTIVPGTNGDLGALPATDWRSIALLFVWPSNSYWFLYAMFWFTLGVWALRRVPVWLKVAGAALVSAAITSGFATLNNLGWNRTAALFLFFLIGALFYDRITKGITKAGPWTLVGLAVLYLGASAVVVAVPHVRGVPFAVTIMQVLAIAVGFVASKYIAMVRPLAAVFGTIGEWSLHIYLLHIFIIVSMASLLEWILPPIGGALGAGIVTVCAVLTTYIAVLLSKLTTKVKWLYVPPMRLRRSRKAVGDSAA